MAEDALARAREIAAKLSGGLAGSDLGKRKNRWDDEPGGSSGPGLGSIQRKKIYFPTDKTDINYLGLIIGPKGSQQKKMSEASGAKILIRGKGASKDGGPSNTGHDDDNDELHVSLEGTEEAVEKASREVEMLFNDTQYALKVKQQQLGLQSGAPSGGDGIYGPGAGGSSDGYQIELRVPNNMVGLIIGKQGENIIRIQTQLGVHAQIAKEHEMLPGETLRSIVLKGTPNNVNEAKLRIDEIIQQQINKVSGGSSNTNNSNDRDAMENYTYVVKLPVPNDKVGFIIGKGGMNIKGIQERTRANVQIPLGPDEDNPAARTLSIGADTKEAVDAAQMEIFMTLQQYAQQAQTQAANNLMILIPDDRVGIVIGKGGTTIKDLQSRLRVRIQIPQTPEPGSMPPMRSISISGPAEAQAQAKYEIEMIVSGTPVHNTRDAQYGQQQQYGGAGMYGGGMYGGGGDASMYGMAAGAAGGYYGAQANPYAAAYGMQQQSQAAYGAGYYGATGAATAGAYGGYGAATDASTATTAAAGATATDAAAVPNDPTAYYNDFWQYSTYYGEAAARTFYGAWSPPEGTPPPAGIVVASPEAAAAALAAAAAQQAPVPDEPANTAPEPAADNGSSGAAAASTTTTAVGASESATTAEDAAAVDPEAAAAAWEAYKKQYAEWYEAHGKAAGADPNPPEM